MRLKKEESDRLAAKALLDEKEASAKKMNGQIEKNSPKLLNLLLHLITQERSILAERYGFSLKDITVTDDAGAHIMH